MTSLDDPYAGTDFYCAVALPNIRALDLVHDGDAVFAYHHTRPYWPVHIVVVPKRHVASLTTLAATDEPLIRELLGVIREVAAAVERDHGSATVVTNLGAYQDSKHLHFHIASGEPAR